MDQALEVFFSWQTLLLCFVISGATFGFRNVVEGVWASATLNRVWSKAVVPVLPLAIGIVLAFVPGIPWPAFLGSAKGAHVAYSFVCGMFSSTVYARYKDFARALPGGGGASSPSKPEEKSELAVMTFKEVLQWVRRNIFSPPILFLVSVVGLLLIGFGFRVFLGGWFRAIRGIPDPETKSVEPIPPIDPDRVDKNGNVIPQGEQDEKGWTQPKVYPIQPPDILSSEDIVVVDTHDGPLEIELPKGVTVEEVKEVVIIKPGVVTVTVTNQDKVADNQTLDTLVEKYGQAL